MNKRYDVRYSADLFPYTKYKMVRMSFDTLEEVKAHFASLTSEVFNKVIFDNQTGIAYDNI